jgi:glutamate/tyrosine decarboxylase-like PLP-dependent enzyme
VDDIANLFRLAADQAATYRTSLSDRAVADTPDLGRLRAAFGRELPRQPTPPDDVLRQLVRAAEPGVVHTAGPRFFGFVIGGALPAASAAEIVAAGWDQCAFNTVLSPAAIVVEERAGAWLKELLCLPAGASTGFVTGAQEANTVGLAAARHHVLSEAGWDVERDGLSGAPRVRVVASVERHATIDRSLRLLGFGDAVIESVHTDSNGAIDTHDLARVLEDGPGGPLIVCLQAGNVNTGACDDLHSACDIVHRHGGWAHVDGAFGLWAAVSPRTRHLVHGLDLADSWGCDGHKWLNVPYDCGFVFCSRPAVHQAAASYAAAYLVGSGGVATAGADLTLQSSRRAHGFAVWAALRELGRDGVVELVDRCCLLARRFADALAAAGAEVANEVVLNQVLVSFGSDEDTDRVITAVQEGGVCWMGGTTWRGRRYMRISVSNWATTERDVDRSVAAILEASRSIGSVTS